MLVEMMLVTAGVMFAVMLDEVECEEEDMQLYIGKEAAVTMAAALMITMVMLVVVVVVTADNASSVYDYNFLR